VESWVVGQFEIRGNRSYRNPVLRKLLFPRHTYRPFCLYSHCVTQLHFQKRFDLADIPGNWALVRIALDWSCQPLLLFVEGKPPQPNFYSEPDAWSHWYRIPPKAHHLIYWEDNHQRSLSFEHSQGLLTTHVQRFEEGWLLGEGRSGLTKLYDPQGRVRSELNLGDASEDLQTTPDGRIWVSYFDEGVFGNGIGTQGVVCFDGKATPLFRYANFAEQSGLPFISDCYAMNVGSNGEVWLNYYTDFPLVRLQNFLLDRIWQSFGALGSAFATDENKILYFQDSKVWVANLLLLTAPEPTALLDETGTALMPITDRRMGMAARGSKVLINTGAGVYEGLISSTA
jgi:hypothetical protein